MIDHEKEILRLERDNLKKQRDLLRIQLDAAMSVFPDAAAENLNRAVTAERTIEVLNSRIAFLATRAERAEQMYQVASESHHRLVKEIENGEFSRLHETLAEEVNTTPAVITNVVRRATTSSPNGSRSACVKDFPKPSLPGDWEFVDLHVDGDTVRYHWIHRADFDREKARIALDALNKIANYNHRDPNIRAASLITIALQAFEAIGRVANG